MNTDYMAIKSKYESSWSPLFFSDIPSANPLPHRPREGLDHGSYKTISVNVLAAKLVFRSWL